MMHDSFSTINGLSVGGELHATTGHHRSLMFLQSHLSRPAYQPQLSSRSRVVILIKNGSELY